MSKRLMLFALGALSFASAVQANDYKVEFVATGFANPGPQVSAPQSIVNGWFVFSTSPVDAMPVKLLSANIDIAGHTYTLGEIGLEYFYDNKFSIGGLRSGVNGLSAKTDDFALSFPIPGAEQQVPLYTLSYTTSSLSANTIWNSSSVILTTSAVPEPATSAMLVVGVGLLGVAARRRAS